MNDRITVNGIVLQVSPIGEADRRLVLLTKELGKISAFAKGARRPGSPLLGATRPFAFGKIELYEGRSSYTVSSMDISNYFEAVYSDLEASCYGSYFLELAGACSGEGLEAGELLRLLISALGALTKPNLDRLVTKAVFELKCMVINGEYTETPPTFCGKSSSYAWEYVLQTPPEQLFRFRLEDDAKAEFIRAVGSLLEESFDREFKSLEILKLML